MLPQKHFNLSPSSLLQRSFAWSPLLLGGLLATVLVACAPVGPDYQPPRQDLPSSWREAGLGDDADVS